MVTSKIYYDGKTVDFEFNNVSYKPSLALMLLIGSTFNCDDLLVINSTYTANKIISLRYADEFKAEYNSNYNRLSFRFYERDTDNARHMMYKVLQLSINRDNFRAVEHRLINVICDKVIDKIDCKSYADRVLYPYIDTIISRQMLIKIFNKIGYTDAEKKAVRYISNNNLEMLRFSHVHKLKVALKNAMKAV